MLSRFRTGSQSKQVLEKLARGAVDIVIGTHRLIQKDIRFKKLGLVIIDEEQRFGVQQKERLKQLRAEVDRVTHAHALYLQQSAAVELENRRQQLRSYLTQARFGIAQVYDRSAGLTETQ